MNRAAIPICAPFLDDFYDRQIEEAIESQTISKRPEILVFEVTVLRTKHEREDVDSHRPVIALARSITPLRTPSTMPSA